MFRRFVCYALGHTSEHHFAVEVPLHVSNQTDHAAVVLRNDTLIEMQGSTRELSGSPQAW